MSASKPKLVISGSASQQDRITWWKRHFEDSGYDVIAFPESWDETKDFKQQLTDLYADFYRAIDECDVFFLMNEDKNGVEGYIGANGTAELIYATMQNLIHNKNITIYIAKIPAKNVLAHDEVISYLKVNWIQVYDGSMTS